MRQNKPNEWWHGLWDFPRIEIPLPLLASMRTNDWTESTEGCVVSKDSEWMVAEFEREHGVEPTIRRYGGSLKHAVTRYRIVLHWMEAELKSTARAKAPLKWHSLDEVSQLPLSAPAKKLLHRLD